MANWHFVRFDLPLVTVGDRVNSHLYSRWIDGEPGPDEPAYCFGMPLPGGLAEYMIIHENSAVRAPAGMSDEEASTCRLPRSQRGIR